MSADAAGCDDLAGGCRCPLGPLSNDDFRAVHGESIGAARIRGDQSIQDGAAAYEVIDEEDKGDEASEV